MAAWEVSRRRHTKGAHPNLTRTSPRVGCCSTSRIVVRRKPAVSSGFVKKKGTLQEEEEEGERFLGTRPLRKAPLRRVFPWPGSLLLRRRERRPQGCALPKRGLQSRGHGGSRPRRRCWPLELDCDRSGRPRPGQLLRHHERRPQGRALRADGFPLISYYDDSDLKVAHCSNPSCAPRR
jgi:hypothetical protein